MEAIDQECVVAPGDLREAPISVTTTETNLTGNWKFSRPELMETAPPCTAGCPLQNDIRSIADLLQRSAPEAALEILRRSNPLPAVTGRVCPGFCSQSCSRAELDQCVQISRLERYLGDLGLSRPYPAPERMRGEKAAVIGSGPAGISAAYQLARQGIGVTVFEEHSSPGGLLAYGIPEYRLPKEVLGAELDNLFRSLPLELVTERRITPSEAEAMQEEYDFLFCAPGLWGTALPREYANSEGVRHGLELLQAINSGHVPQESRFTVVGGGNVALDTARCLYRLGKQARIVYRRSMSQMPAYAEEVRQALEEGIPLLERRLIADMEKAADGLRLQLAEARETEKGIESGEAAERLDTDLVVLAVGQTRELDFPSSESFPCIGDYQDGAGNVARAMASGREAAERALASCGLAPQKGTLQDGLESSRDSGKRLGLYLLQPEPSFPSQESDPSLRVKDFQEIIPTPDEAEVRVLASRCLQCGRCTACGLCWFFCPDMAVRMDSQKQSVEIDVNYCKGCGLCASVCPRGVIQMREDV